MQNSRVVGFLRLSLYEIFVGGPVTALGLLDV